jgi:hypothetical protein
LFGNVIGTMRAGSQFRHRPQVVRQSRLRFEIQAHLDVLKLRFQSLGIPLDALVFQPAEKGVECLVTALHPASITPLRVEVRARREQPRGLLKGRKYDFHCQLQKPTNFEWHNESPLTVSDGIPVLMDATKLSKGRTLKQGLRARVIRDSR